MPRRGNVHSQGQLTQMEMAHRFDNRCQIEHHRRMSNTTMNIALPEPMRAYVAERVAAGSYGNTSEYVRELIRRDQREQERLRLRLLVEQGLGSGPATPMSKADWAELDDIADGKAE
jgi:antitoxin ParD1/3/4